ncbi:MAG: SAM-dependent methyltransferase [Lachnospiraceae bacterium]|nr:SAM-dependent methyltransferase [Lachnospiraceae bacterium]
MDLGKRLAAVAALIEPTDTLADVGCDHGYLSVYLVEQRICRHIIAMDVNKGPLQKARENIQKYGYGDYIETRLSNGLNQLKMNEAAGFICAGMGGPLALEILWNDRDKVKEMQQVILQPQSELWMVRRTLKKWGFLIEKEDIAYEDGKYYFMMRIRPTQNLDMESLPQNEEFFAEDIQTTAYELFAKELLDAKNELLLEYIRKEEKRLQDIHASLCSREDSPKCRARKEIVEKELAVHRWALGRYEI